MKFLVCVVYKILYYNVYQLNCSALLSPFEIVICYTCRNTKFSVNIRKRIDYLIEKEEENKKERKNDDN